MNNAPEPTNQPEISKNDPSSGAGNAKTDERGTSARPLPVQSRQQRKQMIITLEACAIILASVRQREDLKKALECLTRLSVDDMAHARIWLQSPAAVTPGAMSKGFTLETIDKMVALIKSLERVRPRVEQAAAAAKVRGALHNMPTEVKPEDVAKLKAQVEN